MKMTELLPLKVYTFDFCLVQQSFKLLALQSLSRSVSLLKYYDYFLKTYSARNIFN